MPTTVIGQIQRAFTSLNPHQVRELAERPLRVGLHASSSARVAEMEDYLAPPSLSTKRRMELVEVVHRAGDLGAPDHFDLELYEAGRVRPKGTFAYYSNDPERTVKEVLDAREELHLPLARVFEPFRSAVVRRVIQKVSRENAMFTLITALPNIVPSIIELPWAVAEFASDTAVLTTNQVRMSFLLAAASDRAVGYGEQKKEIASIIAGAFGWRALARELVGKIPFGGGIAAKASVAFAGTYVVGTGIERLYRIGYGYTREERRDAFGEALEKGKVVVGGLLEHMRHNNQRA